MTEVRRRTMEAGKLSTDGSLAEEPWKHARWDKCFFKLVFDIGR